MLGKLTCCKQGRVHPQLQLVGPGKSLNGQEKIQAKKSQEGEEELDEKIYYDNCRNSRALIG